MLFNLVRKNTFILALYANHKIGIFLDVYHLACIHAMAAGDKNEFMNLSDIVYFYRVVSSMYSIHVANILFTFKQLLLHVDVRSFLFALSGFSMGFAVVV